MAKLLSGRPWCWGGIDGCRVENKKPQAAVLPAVLRCLVTPEGFTRNGVNYVVCQYFRFLENHGCSLFAHPDISMFFVYLQRKSSYNSLISGCFQC